MRWTPRALLPVAVGFFIILASGIAQAALPNQSADDTAMVDGTGQVRVRAITETGGGRVWVGGQFSEVDTSTGAFIRTVDNLVAFTPGGAFDNSVNIPAVTLTGGGAIVYDMSLSPAGVLYIAGEFDSVGGLPRNNVAAIDPTTGNVLAFHPGGAAVANAVLATSSAVYVGTAKLISYQLNGSLTPGFNQAVAIIDAQLRGHPTFPGMRDIVMVGSTLVVACQCDSMTDGTGTQNVKALVEINSGTGNLVPTFNPGGFSGDQSAAFGISVIVHGTTIYLAAGGSDFTAAYNFTGGALQWKTDTSGSSQAVAWYQNVLLIGGHYDWTEKLNSQTCSDNAHPNLQCWHSPKLSSMDPSTGHVNTVSGGAVWNPGVCCKYNGIWVITPGSDGSTVHIGGEFTKIGGTWSSSGTNWSLNSASNQQYYARLNGPPSNTQPLALVKTSVAGATGTVTSNPAGINCGVSCTNAAFDFTNGANVTLTASASVGNTFLGWSSPDAGFNCPGTGNCIVTMNQARTVTASFAGVTFPLTVTKTGTASPSDSTVTSDVTGINCGATCSAQIPQNTVVTLSATMNPNVQFTGWSGAGCSGTGTCVVTMDAAKNVSANFNSTTASVTITKATSTTGQGTVTSVEQPGGISCNNACNSQTVNFTTPTVTLHQVPKAADAFAGWTSSDPGFSCPGLGDCTVTMDMSRNVVAHFDDAKNVKLSTSVTGGGSVTSDPAIMNCAAPVPTGTTCDQAFAENSTVTLIATPDANSIFTGWSSTGTGNTFVSCPGTGTCTFNMGLFQKQVTATFQAAFPLTVHPDGGSGGGTVTSSPAGINCGLTCGPTNFQTGTNVILTASPDVSSSTFTGWSSADAGFNCPGTGPCTVTMDQARNVTATFTLVQRALTVHVAGQGTVTDTPGPINCTGPGDTGTCNASYEHGTDVQLTPTPAANWSFSGWSGDCSGTDVCVASMTAARNVTATFERIIRTVTVTMAGSGTGTVTSSPDSGIACPGDCTEGFGQGASESLLQNADPNSVFTGWSGDCTGAGACDLTIDSEKNVTATFELLHTLTVNNSPGISGTVSSDVGGISCPSTCSASLAHEAVVHLTAQANPGFAFAGWTGDCAGNETTCTLTIDADKTVGATWDVSTALAVTRDGGGSGTVTSTPAGINCGSTCSHDFAALSSVTLHAAANANSIFTGWSSTDEPFSCPGTGDCTVTMDQMRTVNARFQPTWVLQVQRAGASGGTITSDVGAINCDATCSDSYQDGTVVTLHGADGPNSVFASWTSSDPGFNCPGTADCAVTMDQARTVTAHYNPIVWQLSITESGTGTGGVTSLAPNTGIDCGGACQYDFQQGTSVVLHAAADASSNFIAWSGGGCSGTADCTVSIDTAKTVNAQFDLAQRLMTVTKAGNGNGSVTSDDAGAINCPGTCGAFYAHGTAVTLTAHLGLDTVFTGWTGDACSGSTSMTCGFNMDAAKNVTATFTLVQHTLTVTPIGAGSVTGSGINCPGTCSALYDHGTSIVLTETPGTNMVFGGWSGGTCSGFATTCGFNMNADTGVTATFNPAPRLLTVTRNGSGTGTVTSTPAGITCGTTCTANFNHGTVVGLTPTPDASMTFTGWSGACTGTGPCNVTMDAAKSVTATFISAPPPALRDNDPTIAYNGWFGVADNAANGGFYRMSNVTNDSATWKSPATTSITWVTRTGPDQGKASVTIDGVNKGTVDLYSAAPAASNKVYSGLANKVHTIVIKVLGTKNASSTATNVRLDAFIVGATTTQESDTKIQYDTWKSTAQALATDSTYRSTTNNKATVTVTFTGTSIDWQTTKGKAYGKASVKIDGVAKGTFDMYQTATAWKFPISFTGLSAGPHTMVIQVLGQKNASATSNKVVVDGFIVHA